MKLKMLAAEILGTFWLVLGGCGSAILATGGPTNGIGPLGVALAFGLTVMTMAFAFGSMSGGHFNPAVSVGMAVANRMPWSRVPGYVIAQLVGAILAALVLYVIASGKSGFDVSAGFAANGFGAHSPGGYSVLSAFVAEALLTGFFVMIILGATANAEAGRTAPVIIGLTLTLIYLVLIPVTNAGVNPARSTSQALLVGDWASAQLWLFWIAPLVGAAVGAVIYTKLFAAPSIKRWG